MAEDLQVLVPAYPSQRLCLAREEVQDKVECRHLCNRIHVGDTVERQAPVSVFQHTEVALQVAALPSHGPADHIVDVMLYERKPAGHLGLLGDNEVIVEEGAVGSDYCPYRVIQADADPHVFLKALDPDVKLPQLPCECVLCLSYWTVVTDHDRSVEVLPQRDEHRPALLGAQDRLDDDGQVTHELTGIPKIIVGDSQIAG